MDRMSMVMASAWDFAPPAMAALEDTSDDEEEEAPVERMPTLMSGWRMPQRWLVAAISVLFLYWIWSDHRAERKEPVPAPVPDVVTSS